MLKPSDFKKPWPDFGKSDAADAIAYNLASMADRERIEANVREAIDWDRLRDNGMVKLSDEAIADMDRPSCIALSNALDRFPFDIMRDYSDCDLTYRFQRVHYAERWTGRTPDFEKLAMRLEVMFLVKMSRITLWLARIIKPK